MKSYKHTHTTSNHNDDDDDMGISMERHSGKVTKTFENKYSTHLLHLQYVVDLKFLDIHFI